MNYRYQRVALVLAAIFLAASTASPQQTSMVVLSASGTTEATLKVKAFANERHFIVQAIGDAVTNNPSGATLSLWIKIVDDGTEAGNRNFKSYGCVKNTARLVNQSGRLHVETSCEIVVMAEKMVTVTAESRIQGARVENITLKAASSW